MALWQFSIEFVPRYRLIDYFGEIPKAIDGEIYWKENFTDGVTLPEGYENFLNSLGQKEELTWDKESYNWGDYDNGTHLTIVLENKDNVSVRARVNVGECDKEFVKTMLEFAKMCNCVLWTKNETIIEPEMDLFIDEVKKSNSYRFCKDPIGYLQSDEVKQLNWQTKRNFSE